MAHSDSSDKWQDLMAGYVLENLSDQEAAELRQLLEDRPELRHELQRYEATLAQLPQGLPLETPAPRLEQALLSQIHALQADQQPDLQSAGQAAGQADPLLLRPQHRPQRSPRRGGDPGFPRHRLAWGVGRAIAAGLLLFLGWDNYTLRRSLTANQQQLNNANSLIQELRQNQQQTAVVLASLSRPGAMVYPLLGTGSLADASGSLVTVPDAGEAIFIARNVPALPEDQVYRLWAIQDATTAPLYCGEFNPEADDTTTRWVLPASGCSTQPQQLLITIDPVDSPPVPVGELVLQSQPS